MNRAVALIARPDWLLVCSGSANRAVRPRVKSEWDKVVEAAKKEGKVVVSIPTSAELRKEFESGFQKAYPGIELELNVARGASNINKIAEEQNAGRAFHRPAYRRHDFDHHRTFGAKLT